jgi:hypothetical protein
MDCDCVMASVSDTMSFFAVSPPVETYLWLEHSDPGGEFALMQEASGAVM